MNLSGKKLWQVGAGDTDRKYDHICMKYDVMIAGPGYRGPYEETLYKDLRDKSLHRFCIEARRGDIVLLRLGTGKICAVGEICDDASEWLETFSDVDGWDLQHVRRVRWFKNTENSFSPRTLGGQVRTFAEVNVKTVRTWVEGLDVADADFSRELVQLPEAGVLLTPAELGKQLFIEGLPSEHVDKLMSTFSSLERVATWYWNETKRPKGRPSEQETVCYLVVPFLLSLGWSQQTAAIQWNYVDVALFHDMPPTDTTLTCVVEAKGLSKSVISPLGQARNYALKPGRENCKRLIITDGIRYTLYCREDNNFNLNAYLNILNMRDGYPIWDCDGAVQAVLGMAR